MSGARRLGLRPSSSLSGAEGFGRLGTWSGILSSEVNRAMPGPNSLVRLLTLLVMAGCGGQAFADCIASGTEVDINAALVGKGADAVLCPGALFTLSNPVVFTAPNQRIYTQGFQTGASRAVLRIGGGPLTKAIDGNNQSGIAIQYIEVDGNRGELGYQPGDALIEIGHAGSDQTVQNIVAHDTRSWSCLHIHEGRVIDGTPQCQNATITDNLIGPACTPSVRWAGGITLDSIP